MLKLSKVNGDNQITHQNISKLIHYIEDNFEVGVYHTLRLLG